MRCSCCPSLPRLESLNSRLLRKHWFKLFQEIKAVDTQLKPAWLNDFLDVDVPLLNSLLQWLFKENLIRKQLQAIEVSHDLLVVDIQIVTENISKTVQCLNESTDLGQLFFCLVKGEVASILNHNSVKRQLISCLEGILSEIKDSQQNCRNINAGTFTPTIFGILLGYPVVYVQMTELSAPLTLDLTVWTFTFKICQESGKEHTEQDTQLSVCYSFSFPTAIELSSTQKILLEEWKCRITGVCVTNSFKYNFCESKKLNANVIL